METLVKFAAIGLLACTLQGGIVIQCGAPCLSKIASLVSIGANGKTIVAGTKKVLRIRKTTQAKAKRT